MAKFSSKKAKTGLMNTLYIIAGLFAAGMIEQFAMSKIAFLADTKTDASGNSTKNILGTVLKSGIYIAGGLMPAQFSDNEILQWMGYGVSGYGGLKAVKVISDTAKVYGLGGVHPGAVNLPPYPQYQIPENGTSFESM